MAVLSATQKGRFVNKCAKYMANLDLLCGARVLGLLTASQEQAHARMAHEMRGLARTKLFYAEWARRS